LLAEACHRDFQPDNVEFKHPDARAELTHVASQITDDAT
jgi:hypothetical protein